VERIRAGAFEKIVLAREVAVHAPIPHDAAAVFGVLRAGFSSCYVFCHGTGDAAFVAASPELLVRREGLRASNGRAPHGSRPPLGADPIVGRSPRRAASCARTRIARSTRSSPGGSRGPCAR
jgi:salicylate biosynthesis isochorismate synthase/menaquinone-specific isochorismate synthase